MNSFGYYASEGEEGELLCNNGSRIRQDYPLAVNCAGVWSTSEPFVTYNGIGRQDYYLLYIVEGALTVDIGGREEKVGPFRAMIFPPKYKYKYSYSGGKPLVYYWVHFSGSEVEAVLQRLGICEYPAMISVGYNGGIENEYRALFDAFLEKSGFMDYELSCRMGSILALIMRSAAGVSHKTPLYKSIRYLNTAYKEQISVAMLAEMEGLSQSRYSVLFKEQTGASPIEYLTQVRMKNAALMLTATDLSILTVAAEVGYPDNHFFSKIFKARMGMPPTEYRRKYGTPPN